MACNVLSKSDFCAKGERLQHFIGIIEYHEDRFFVDPDIMLEMTVFDDMCIASVGWRRYKDFITCCSALLVLRINSRYPFSIRRTHGIQQFRTTTPMSLFESVVLLHATSSNRCLNNLCTHS